MKIKKTIFLHIGTHKTGSTTIQHALIKNNKSLKKNKFIFLKSGCLHQVFRENTYNSDLVRKCKKNMELRTMSFITNYKYIISNETFSGNVWEGYANTEVIAQMLKDIFSEFDVKIIVYLRRQDLFIESVYTQYIHEGGVLSFDEYLEGIKLGEDFNWEKLVQIYCQKFSEQNVIVKVFQKENFYKGNLVEDFANILNFKFINANNIENKNISYSRDVLEIAREANKYLDPKQKKEMRIELQKVSNKINSPRFHYLTNECRQKVISSYEQSNNNLLKRDFESDMCELFSGEYPKGEKYQSITNENLSKILMLMILNNKNQYENTYTLRLVWRIEHFIKKTGQLLLRLPIIFIKYIFIR